MSCCARVALCVWLSLPLSAQNRSYHKHDTTRAFSVALHCVMLNSSQTSVYESGCNGLYQKNWYIQHVTHCTNQPSSATLAKKSFSECCAITFALSKCSNVKCSKAPAARTVKQKPGDVPLILSHTRSHIDANNRGLTLKNRFRSFTPESSCTWHAFWAFCAII